MASNLGYIPSSVVGGESIIVSASNPFEAGRDIIIAGIVPAEGTTLAYTFQATPPITVAAVANGAATGWTLEVTGVQTLTMKPGAVAFAGMVTIGGRSKVVDSGSISVSASPLRQSSWLAVIAAIDASMLTAAASQNGSMSIDGMTVSYRSPAQLTALRDYAVSMAAQDSASRTRRIIRTRFNVL